MVRHHEKIPAGLPERLTISFPIWGLYDTGSHGCYRDFDAMMREHTERGFNCIRLDDGAGLMHDLDGHRRQPVLWGHAFGKYENCMRQFNSTGEGGYCDVHSRLIELFTAAKKHHIYIILSSWYYLHTCWFVKDRELNDRLHSIPPHQRFMAFARFLHYILCELEDRGLDSQIAFAEIFNEADGLRFVNGYGDENHLSDAEIAVFRKEHEEAIQWLRERHPAILFGFDSWTYYTDKRQIPKNMQVYNFHNYFLFSVYTNAIENDMSLLRPHNRISIAEIKAASDCAYPPTDDWYQRVWFYQNLDENKIPAACAKATDYLHTHMEEIRDRLRSSVEYLEETLTHSLPPVPAVCGEGVSYCGGYTLVWEETSADYWQLIQEMMAAYRKLGLWGTVVRTCCGPEDPVWTRCPEQLLAANRAFLGK